MSTTVDIRRSTLAGLGALGASATVERTAARDSERERTARQVIANLNYAATRLIVARALMSQLQADGGAIPKPVRDAWAATKLGLAAEIWPACRALSPGEFTVTLPASARLGTPCETVVTDEEFVRRLQSANPDRIVLEAGAVSGGLGFIPLVLVPLIPLITKATVAIFVVSSAGAAIWKLADTFGPEALTRSARVRQHAGLMQQVAEAELAGRKVSPELYKALERQSDSIDADAKEQRKATCDGFVDCMAARLSGAATTVLMLVGGAVAVSIAGPPLLRMATERMSRVAR